MQPPLLAWHQPRGRQGDHRKVPQAEDTGCPGRSGAHGQPLGHSAASRHGEEGSPYDLPSRIREPAATGPPPTSSLPGHTGHCLRTWNLSSGDTWSRVSVPGSRGRAGDTQGWRVGPSPVITLLALFSPSERYCDLAARSQCNFPRAFENTGGTPCPAGLL